MKDSYRNQKRKKKGKLTVQTIAQASQAQVGYFPLVDYHLVACQINKMSI